jgi:steroid Delta-isomerase
LSGLGDVATQARQVMDNLVEALAAAGATLTGVLKTTVYVASSDRVDLVTAWCGPRSAAMTRRARCSASRHSAIPASSSKSRRSRWLTRQRSRHLFIRARSAGTGALTRQTRTCSTFGMAEQIPTIKELARASQAAAGRKDRAAWLALFSPDAVVEDPIGPSVFDPEGKGHRGIDGVTGFYDNVIEKAERIDFDIERTYICGNEMADVGTIRTTLAGGTHVAVVPGVFTYRGDGAGKLIALRAFWQMDMLTLVEA